MMPRSGVSSGACIARRTESRRFGVRTPNIWVGQEADKYFDHFVHEAKRVKVQRIAYWFP
jgi:hypothetical protein